MVSRIDKELLEFLALVHPNGTIPHAESNGHSAATLDSRFSANGHSESYNPDNLRILMTTTFYADSTGIGIVAKELSEALRKKGQTVDVLHLAPSTSEAVLIRNDGATQKFPGLEGLLSSGEGYDIVHLHDYVFFGEGWKDRFDDIAAKLQAPLVYTIHSSTAQSQRFFGVPADQMKPYTDAQKRTVERADIVVTLTEEGREFNFPDNPQYKSKFAVIQNGASIPTESIELSRRTAELKQRYGIKDNDKVILYIGRIDENKGVVELAESLSLIKEEFPESKLVFTGPFRTAALEERIKGIFDRYGLKESVVFTGELHGLDKDSIYQISNLVALPSYGESLPLVALESMARKRPIVITKVENYTRTFMLEYPERRLALPIEEMRSPKAVADAVLYALRHPEDMQRIVERGYNAVQTYFNWDAAADKTLLLYRTLVALKGRRTNGTNPNAGSFSTLEDAISSLENVLRANPNDGTVKQSLIGIYDAKLATFRAELMRHEYDQERISQAREISERRRNLSIEDSVGYKPEVSVVIPVYVNKKHPEGIDYLLETVDNVLRQNFDKPYEIIIVDDASELNTVAPLLERFGSSVRSIRDEDGNVAHKGPETGKIKIIKQSVNRGPLAARVAGYKEALKSGAEFISNFDSDDLMEGYRVQALHDYLTRNPTTDMVHSRHISIDVKGRVISGSNPLDDYYYGQRKWVIGMDTNDPANEGKSVRHDAKALRELDNNNFVHSPSTMFRANVIYRIGMDNIPDDVRWGEDWTLWKLMKPLANMDYFNIQTVFYRQHNGNMTNGGI